MPYLSASVLGLAHKKALYQVSSTFTFTFTFISHSWLGRIEIVRLIQTIVTDYRGVCLSVCLSCGFTVRGSFGAAFAKSLWPLVVISTNTCCCGVVSSNTWRQVCRCLEQSTFQRTRTTTIACTERRCWRSCFSACWSASSSSASSHPLRCSVS